MAVLVIADHDGAIVRDTTHKTVTAALALSSDVDVLVLGKGAQAGHVVRRFDVQDITEATALALMEDMLTGMK
jgi:electron transfer flavoprotein alpha subunit